MTRIKSQWKVFLFAADKRGDLHFPVGILIARIFALLTQPATLPEHKLFQSCCLKQSPSKGLMAVVCTELLLVVPEV